MLYFRALDYGLSKILLLKKNWLATETYYIQ